MPTKKISTKKPSNAPKPVNLALQGGGSHGAFGWGVLDRLLEDERLAFDGLCATSAGSMNAVVCADGMLRGGREGARKRLQTFWHRVSHERGSNSPWKLPRLPWEHSFKRWSVTFSPLYALMDTATRYFSPYELNPGNYNPLKDILEDVVDFKALKECNCLKLFISCTNVQTGRVRVFENQEVTLDVVLASACLPSLFQTVEINGEHFWDGGYMGNPAIYPLVYHADSLDVIIVHINPIHRQKIPTKARDIMNRVNEITFNSSLLKELRAIEFVTRLLKEDMLKDEYKSHFKNLLIHSIRSDDVMCDLGVSTKFNLDWSFLLYLKDLGRAQADKWLRENFDHIGKRSSVDLRSEFLGVGKTPHAG